MGEETETRECEREESEDMASEERQGEVTPPSKPTAHQHTSQPATAQSDLLKKLKKQEKNTKKAKAALRKMRKENAALKKTMKIRDKLKTFFQRPN